MVGKKRVLELTIAFALVDISFIIAGVSSMSLAWTAVTTITVTAPAEPSISPEIGINIPVGQTAPALTRYATLAATPIPFTSRVESGERKIVLRNVLVETDSEMHDQYFEQTWLANLQPYYVFHEEFAPNYSSNIARIIDIDNRIPFEGAFDTYFFYLDSQTGSYDSTSTIVPPPTATTPLPTAVPLILETTSSTPIPDTPPPTPIPDTPPPTPIPDTPPPTPIP